MGLWDKLRRASNYARKLRVSLGPGSYYQYKRRRDYERKDADRERAEAKTSVQHGREDADRAREYEARYAAEQERDVAGERTEPTGETKPDH